VTSLQSVETFQLIVKEFETYIVLEYSNNVFEVFSRCSLEEIVVYMQHIKQINADLVEFDIRNNRVLNSKYASDKSLYYAQLGQHYISISRNNIAQLVAELTPIIVAILIKKLVDQNAESISITISNHSQTLTKQVEKLLNKFAFNIEQTEVSFEELQLTAA
jgi:hypothetical protein